MAAAAAHASSKGMYSWWWNSHISPKNSKWLQENLTDMDTKVSQMIKLIEEDADSFARRAEMYYKKRPELMKLVEEFYRAYRALAERYDHATSVLRQAHKTMAEAFPNQVPSMLLDDSPASESDPRTPEVPFTGRSLIDLEEFNKDLGNSNSHILRRNGAFTEESDSVVGRKGFKQFNDAIGFAEGKARRGLNFHGEKGEMEIENLKKAIAELEAEKEAGRVQYQQNLERSSDLELELSRAQEECEKLKDRARQAEAEVETLKELLAKLEAEKKANLIQYEQCLEKISGLEKGFSSAQNDALEFNERASRAETESAMLKLELLEVKAEKEAALAQYKESMEKMSGVEEKLMQAEEDMRRVVERANNAESAVESLKEEIAKLAAEKEAVAMRCNECLETISNLKCEISVAQEETKRLNTELVNGVEKLKGVEERCVLLERSNQTLHSELESLAQKSASQSQELSEKQQELGQLWAGIQEERLRFVEAETAFQTLQHLHSQSQEELRSLAAQLQNRNQLLNDMEVRNQGLQDEFLKAHEENKNLNELNLSSSLSIKSLQEEIVNLREMIQKLEAEIELRIDERNALQQEIYCLKEELNDLNKKHHLLLDQVDRVGLDPNSLGQSVKELQDENSELKLTCERDASEKAILLQKLAAMDKLLEKNILLENSLSDLNVELEGVREKVNSLEESCQSLLREKSNLVFERDTLVSKLQVATEYSQELEEKNKILENSLSDANTELEESRVISKSLEESCLLLGNEKSALIMEKENLVLELDSSQQRMENLETRHKELHEKSSLLETERVSFLNEILELKNILDVQRTENASLSQQSKARLADMGSQLLLMQQQLQSKDNEYKEELDKNIIFQIEMFILHNSILDLKDQNSLLTLSCQKLVEASKFSEERVSHLEHENFAQQTELNTLSDEINVLRTGLHQISEMLEMGAECGFEYDLKQGQALLDPISCKVRDLQGVLFESEEENLRIYVEKLVLHTVLLHRDLDVADLMAKMKTLEYNHRIQSERFVLLKTETQKVLEYSEDLGLKVLEGVCREDVLRTEMKILHEQLLDVQGAFQNLKEENHLMLQENRCLSNDILLLREEKCALEEENATIFNETIFEASNHLVFRSIIPQKLMELKELNEVLSKLHSANLELEDKLKWTEQSLENMLTENLHLKGLVEKSESDLMSIRSVNDQLNSDIANKKEVLCQLETKLLEAEQVVNSVETMKAELEKEFKHLKTDYAEIQITGEDQKKQILKLSEDYKQQSEEAESLREAKQQVEVELSKLLQEHDDQKVRGLSMYLELERQSDEIVQWEEQAVAVLRDLIFSNVHEALLEEKIRDLSQACESLTESKFAELEQLKERVSTLEGQNKGLNSKLAGYRLDIASLEKAVSSLESLTGLSKELGKAASEDKCTDDAQEAVEEITCTVADGSSAMQILLRRIQTIEEALLEMRSAATLEKSSTHAKLEAAMEEIERLKSISSLDQENSRASQHVPENLCDGAANHVKPKIEISEAESELLTKDIMLDQISECSSYGISKRGTVEADDQMLEFSESTGKNGSTDLKVGKVQKGDILQSDFQKVKARRENRSLNPSAESLLEKELDIDKISGTGSFSSFQSQGGNKKKVLERLDSDALKLTNLQITVKDLMRKVASTEKARNGKGLEYDVVKGQLEEAELEIKNLLETNQKLVKNVDDGFFSTDTKSSKDFDSGGNISRRRISEQARRGYERIGRLQLEVQKIQLLLLKLDEEKESRGKARMLERRTRVLLRDYLYGGGRSNQNGKKAPFCSCMQPPTKGD